MKNILILILLFTNIFANTQACRTDIYFGNGVWNDEIQTFVSTLKLEKFLREQGIKFSSPETIGGNSKRHVMRYIHNETHGEINDLIETHYQLLKSGQISEGYFSFVTRALNVVSLDFDYSGTIRDIINKYKFNTAGMLSKYENTSFRHNHNVLLIAHSQGNLFGNDIYKALSDNQKRRFKMVSVGTPADNVLAGYSSYTTMHGDLLIRSIPNSLASNTDGFGHTFVESYLKSEEATANMMQDINAALNIFNSKPCTKSNKYDYYRLISYMCPTRQEQELIVDIYGTPSAPDGELKYEEYITSDYRIRVNPMTFDFDKITYYDSFGSTSNYDKNGCQAFNITDTSLEWAYLTGRLENKTYDDINYGTLNYIKNSTYFNRHTSSIYTMNSEVFDILRSNTNYYIPTN